MFFTSKPQKQLAWEGVYSTPMKQNTNVHCECVGVAAQERRGAGDPLGEGQMQFCSLHKDSCLLADLLNARPLPPFSTGSLQVLLRPGQLCVCTDLPFVRGCSQRPARQGLLLGVCWRKLAFQNQEPFWLVKWKEAMASLALVWETWGSQVLKYSLKNAVLKNMQWNANSQ